MGMCYSYNKIIKDERKMRRASASPTTVSTAVRAQGEWGQRPFPLRSAESTPWGAELLAYGNLCPRDSLNCKAA